MATQLEFFYVEDTKNYAKYQQVDGINKLYLPQTGFDRPLRIKVTVENSK